MQQRRGRQVVRIHESTVRCTATCLSSSHLHVLACTAGTHPQQEGPRRFVHAEGANLRHAGWGVAVQPHSKPPPPGRRQAYSLAVHGSGCGHTPYLTRHRRRTGKYTATGVVFACGGHAFRNLNPHLPRRAPCAVVLAAQHRNQASIKARLFQSCVRQAATPPALGSHATSHTAQCQHRRITAGHAVRAAVT